MAVPTEQQPGWGPQPVWTSGIEKNFLAMPGFEPLVVHPVAEGKVGLRGRSFLECAVIIPLNQPQVISTMHTVAVRATTAARGDKVSERCDARAKREWRCSALIRKVVTLLCVEIKIFS